MDALEVAMKTQAMVEALLEPKPPAVSLEVARAVVWYFGDHELGVEPGGHMLSLIRTISRADQTNLERHRLGFPEEVLAVTALQRESWGFDWLRKICREAVR